MKPHTRPNRVLLLGGILALLSCPILVTCVHATPAGTSPLEVGAYFEFSNEMGLENGAGWYSDWWEETTSTGRSEVVTVNATHVTVRLQESWEYRDSYGDRDAGTIDRRATFDQETRHYTSTQTDLDAYDDYDTETLAIWFWVPPDLQVGESIAILDDTFVVAARDYTLWLDGVPHETIRLEAAGEVTHRYEDKNWDGNYHDYYYFDPVTGFVLAAYYSESHAEYFHGEWTRWTWYERFEVKAASYPGVVDVPAVLGVVFGILGGIAAVVLAALGIWHRRRWKPVVSKFEKIGLVTTFRVKTLAEFPAFESKATDYFADFLWLWAKKTLLAGGRCVAAVNRKDQTLFGVGYYTKQEKVATILCKHTHLTETIRRHLGAKEWFTEQRHQFTTKDLKEMKQVYPNQDIPEEMYNLYETYQVLRLAPVPAPPFDTRLVSFMQLEDLDTVKKIARQVYEIDCDAFLEAQFKAGDVGVVARVGDKIVGFAFAEFTGKAARVHTLTVLPSHRNQGIGQELMRARMMALANLGMESVITEIAEWNLPSLRVSQKQGFEQVGRLYVETSRSKRVGRKFYRW